MAHNVQPSELGDVIIVQLPAQSWQLQDRAGAVLDGRIFNSLLEATTAAFELAVIQGGTVWLREPRHGLVKVATPSGCRPAHGSSRSCR